MQAGDKSAWNVDFLLEKKVGDGGAFSVESEYANYDKLGGYDAQLRQERRRLRPRRLPVPEAAIGPGKFEILGKYAKAQLRRRAHHVDVDYDQKTTEVNFNYIIKEFNARVMIFYKNTDFTAVQTELQAVRRRPADPDVTRRPLRTSAFAKESHT